MNRLSAASLSTEKAKLGEYVCRALAEQDLQRLVELCQQHAEFEGSSFEPRNKLQQFKKLFFGSNSRMQCRVIEHGQDIVAYATFILQFSTWQAEQYVYLDCLFVEFGARNQGVGSQLIREAIRYAKQNKCTTLQWQTPLENRRAVEFYDKIPGTNRKSKWRYTCTTKTIR